MKENLKHQSNLIAIEPTSPSSAELSLAYKELQENKMLINYLVDQNKALKEQLQVLKKNMQHAKQSQRNMLANISHEIRTPLNAIVGLSNTLKDITDENERKENVAIIENAAFVLGAVISNIIDTAKIDSHDARMDIHPFNIKSLIKNLQTTFIYRLKNKPVEFETVIDENLPEMIEGDEQKILHVLFNLLSISEKYTEHGTIKLSVTVLKALPGKIITGFIVEDTGRSLSSDDPRLSYKRFEDYVEKRKKLNKDGLGLGLPVTNTLIKLLKGEIKIGTDKNISSTEGNAMLESNTDTGVKITIVLPLKPHKRVDESTKIISSAGDTLLSALNILIAEDTDLNRKYLSILLNKWDITHTFVNNGSEAIEKINTNDFDLVLLDINMPVLDGFETTKAIRAMKEVQKSSVPIIGVSASVLAEYKIKGKKTGMNHFLPKPFKPEQLKELLMQFAVEKQTKNTSPVNIDIIKEFFGNDYTAAAEIFKIFLEESIPEINGWSDLLQLKGVKVLGARAHALKPAMEMLGLTSLSEGCFDLEEACISGEDQNSLQEKIKRIKSEIVKAEPQVVKQYQFITQMLNKND